MNTQAIKEAVARAAAEYGVQDYEISLSARESAGAEALKDEISSVTYSNSGTMEVRCVKDGRSGYATSDLIDPAAAAQLVATACANAGVIDDTDTLGLFPGSDVYRSTDDRAADLPATDEMKEQAMELQRRTYAASDKVVDGTQCAVQGMRFTSAMMNSAGLDLDYGCSIVFRVVSAGVKDGEDAADDYRVVRTDAEDPQTTVDKTVTSALSKLGAEPVDSGKYNIIIASGALRDLLETYADVFSARSAYLKTSLLAGKEGQEVASPLVTLVDDPFYPGKFLHCPFDGEGVAVYAKNVIEKGQLKTLLYNRMYAKLMDRQTTGNAADAKFIEPKGLYFAPGELTAEQLLAKLDSGLYITALNGLHAGANVQSGDFSLQAEGYLVEGGKKARPAKNITIADNFFQMLKKVDAISDKVEFGAVSDFGAPEILFTQVSVSGK